MSSPNRVVHHITSWKPHGVREIIGFSGDNFVGLMEDGCSALKYAHSPDRHGTTHIREEANRYTRVGQHDNIVTFKALTDDGLVLEYCERGSLVDSIDILNEGQKICIAAQIARGLIHLHKQHFVHCDLNVRNVFLTSDFTAKIGDLQGQLSRPDGTIEMETIGENCSKSRLPVLDPDSFSVQSDIFAMGTLLYHVWHGHPPFPELDELRDDAEIESKYRRKEFPIDIANAVGMEKIIWQCWTLEYANASEILDDITLLNDSRVEEHH